MWFDDNLVLTKTRINTSETQKNDVELELLRLDLLHPIISGNKYFKLKFHLKEAITNQSEGILSFGGAYSNHLHALAFASNLFGLRSIGIIRGEEPKEYNHTLRDCLQWGMQLKFISRDTYRHTNDEEILRSIQNEFPHYLLVPEGGNSALGLAGAEEIYKNIGDSYDYICVAVGTATTLRGIATQAASHQQVIGFSALRNAFPSYQAIAGEVLNQEFHFGGFAKQSPVLLSFMNDFKQDHGVELDFIYTAKMMLGIFELIQNGFFPKGSKLLAVHSGGLQGNRSL